MKKLILSLSFLLFLGWQANSQTPPNTASPADTSQYPYWIEMMQDPSVNFFKVQRAFELYWQNRTITRSHGWKVFKRWEYMMQSRVSATGERPAPDATVKAYESFVRNNRSATTGNWVSLGPSTIPLPGPAGYEGLGRINSVAWHPTDANKIYIGAPSGGMWQSADGGLTWVTHTDSLATLGVSTVLVDFSNPANIFIGTGDRDAGDAPGLGVYKSTDAGITFNPSNTGMGNKTVGKIIQHPTNGQILLAATSSGVYRSINNGTNWTLSKSGNFKDVVFKPGDPNIVYAVAGAEFFRSTDNGVNFTKITSGLIGGQRLALAVTPANPAYVYLLLSGGDSGFEALFLSTNSGASFTGKSTSPNILDWSCDGSGTGGQAWYDLAIAADPINANTIYVGGVDVWKSTDGGSTWSINSHWYGGCGVPAVHADCHFLGYSPVNGKLYAGNDGGIWSTNDGGTTWTDLTVGITIGQIYKLGQAQQVKDHVINGFQDNGTYTLTTGGWLATGGGDGMECAIDYQNDAYSYHTIYYGDIYRTFSNGSENHIAGNGVNGITEDGDWVTPFVLHATDPNTMFIGYKNIWRSKSVRVGNPTWVKISDNLGGSNSSNMRVVESSPANPNLLYASRTDSKFFRTDNCMDGLPAWIELTSYLPSSGTPSSIEASPVDENVVYITMGGSVFKSQNKGLSWTNITGNLPGFTKNTIACYKNDNEGLYVGTDAGVYYKNSGMTNWVSFSSGLPVNGRITELDIYYDNDSVSADVIRASSYGRGLWGSSMYQSAPDVDFTASATTTPASCSISFTDLSAFVPTSWLWTFDGGTPATSALKNPANISYNTPGTFSVKLKAWNASGIDSLTKTGYIHVTGSVAPVADFSSDQKTVCTGELVRFYDETQNCPNAWMWEFLPATITYMEGTSSTSQNPVVAFDGTGEYTVRLTAFNNTGSNSITKTAYILYGGYRLPFTEDFENGFGRNNWSIQNPDGDITWDTITVAGTVPGHIAAWMNFFDYTLVYKRDQMVSAPLNLSNYSQVTLTFQHAYAQRANIKDSLIVKLSSDCGNTWTRLLSLGPDGTPNTFVTHETTLDAFYPQSAADWCGGGYGVNCYSVDMTPWAGMENVKLMFESFNRRGDNLFLDNIMISGITGIPENTKSNSGIMIFPNPSNGVFNLLIPKGNPHMEMRVTAPGGQVVYQEKLTNEESSFTRQINLSHLTSGVYYLYLTSESINRVEKIIIY